MPTAKPYNIRTTCTHCGKYIDIPYYCRGHVVTCPECGIEPLFIPIATPIKKTRKGFWTGVFIFLVSLFLAGMGFAVPAAVPLCVLLGLLSIPILSALADISARLQHLEELAATHVEPAPVPDDATDAE